MNKISTSFKEKWNAYLKRLAESNKQLYGSGKPDCCDINKKDNETRKS
jgi:hypothetical protein